MRFVVERSGHEDYGTIVQDGFLITKRKPEFAMIAWDALVIDEHICRDIDKTADLLDSKNVRAHHSQFDFYQSSESVKLVCDEACNTVEEYVSVWNSGKWDIKLVEGWGIRYSTGDSTRKHSHFPHTWSFVYMVEGCRKCSPLELYSQPDESLKKIIDYKAARRTIQFEPGKLLVFPGWITHEGKEHQCKHPRYAVAGNISQISAHLSGKIINVDGYISGNNR